MTFIIKQRRHTTYDLCERDLISRLLNAPGCTARIYMIIALRRFLHNHGNIATEGSQRQHCTLHAFEQEHCICTTTMTNIRTDRDSNLVPPGYKPQLIRLSHRGAACTARGDDAPFVRKICRLCLRSKEKYHNIYRHCSGNNTHVSLWRQ